MGHVSGKGTSGDVLDLPMIRLLPEDLARRVAGAGFSREASRRSMIFQEGEVADGLWALLEGRIKLVRTSRNGKELLVHLVEAGQTFAESALFQHKVYPVTAIAVTKCRLWHWPLERLLRLLRNSPELGLALLASAAEWNRKVISQLQLLTQRRVEERLAIYILGRLGKEKIESGAEVSLDLPKKLIAAVLGMAPEVFSRTLRRLEDAGIVGTGGGGLRILDPKSLRRLSRGELELS